MNRQHFFSCALALVLMLYTTGNAHAQYPVTVQNAFQGVTDRQITVTAKPQKVLTFGPNCTELFVALGLSDLVIGNSLNNHSRGPLPEYAEAYKRIPELNYAHATREAVLTSGADFIFGIDWQFGGSHDSMLSIEELEQYGIVTYVETAQSLENAFQEIRDIGKIFNITERSERFLEDQQKRIQAVQQKTSTAKPLKVLVYDSGNNGVFTCSGASFESELIALAGGQNLFHDLGGKVFMTVSYEEILARDPDIILIHDYDAPSVEAKIREIRENSTLAQVNAVRNNRFAAIELESVLPGSRMAHTVERLAKNFHPGLFREGAQ